MAVAALAAAGLGLTAGSQAAHAQSVRQVGASSVIVAEGPGQSLYYYWQVGNSSVVAGEGARHTLNFYWQTISTVPWHPKKVAGP